MNKDNPLSILWIGRATIYEYETITDPETFKSTQQLHTTITDEPCRVSYENQKHSQLVSVSGGVTNVEQTITLFIRPDIIINAGSIIEVTQHGRTVKYKRSSVPMLYTNHQEVMLELYEDHA